MSHLVEVFHEADQPHGGRWGWQCLGCDDESTGHPTLAAAEASATTHETGDEDPGEEE